MANLPTDPGTGLEPKMVLLPQLKRYDQKIKEKINNSSSSYITGVSEDLNSGIYLDVTDGTLSAQFSDFFNGHVAIASVDALVDDSGTICFKAVDDSVPTGFTIDPKGGINISHADVSDTTGISTPRLVFKLNVGKGVKLDPNTGALEANVDGITIGINGNTGMMSVRPTESITVANQPSSGSVLASCSLDTVCVRFADVFVSGFTKTKVGQIAKTYAPSVKTTGNLAAVGSSGVLTAYCQVDTDGSIYINPVRASSTDAVWTGVLTYLI